MFRQNGDFSRNPFLVCSLQARFGPSTNGLKKMAYVITNACVKDDVCATSCPEEAISVGVVTVDGKAYDQYFIDSAKCSDCGTCESGCPEMAIYMDDDLPAAAKQFKAVNAAYFAQ